MSSCQCFFVAKYIEELSLQPDLFRGRRKQSNHHQLPKKPPNGCLKRTLLRGRPIRPIAPLSRSFNPWEFGFAHHQTTLRVRAAHHDEVCCRAGFFVQVFVGDDQRRADPDGLRKAVSYLIGDSDACSPSGPSGQFEASLAAMSAAAIDTDETHDHEHGFEWQEAARIAFVVITAAAVWFGIWEPVRSISLIGVIGLLVGGWPILKEAFENLLARRMTMELSMTIAIAAAAAIGEFFTALVITLFVLVAEVLEGMTVSRGRHAIHDLVHFLPQTVSVRRLDGVREIHVDELRVGDAVLVNPGGRVPVDGTVINGHSFLDQSRITGESMPVEKIAVVFAGSINQSGAIEVRADRIGRDTSYGKIIEAVETAERSRAPVQRLADRMAGYLVYFALGAAALTYLITRDLRSTISVIIVAGACGIAAGTPLAILGAIGRAVRLGAIIKGGLYLETLGRVDTVVLDKTGTLTYGRPEVQKVIAVEGTTIEAVLDAAATAELRSEHPLGQAIVAYARAQGRSIPEPDRFDYTPGRGISASSAEKTILVGNRALLTEHGVAAATPASTDVDAASEIIVACDGRLLGAIVVADTVRSEARHAIEALDGMRMRTILLTGDARLVASAVARKLGIREVEADLLPEDLT